eukprot:TRINITY_DN5397_c0_g1_i3.p1 TRINITY_DN5397_c0_g1~~TRINITY_DN5397_c0_g1_i3.p1  ORF type:complete len:610 (+),score=105.31 TRINITY_DN5397_c0_g1_i3:294-2123(+)
MAVDLAKVSHSTTIAAVVEGLRSELVYKKNMLCYKCERKNKTVPAEQFCQNCNAPFCGPCCSKAHANRYMATHTMSLISEGKKIALLEQCSVHGKPKDVYCKEDKQLCCLYCTALSGSIHKTHTVIAVCDAATECRAQLAAAQSEVAQAEETLSKVSPCVEKAVKDVARAMEAAQETMEAFCTQATTTLEATRQRVTVAIAKFASEKQAALAKQSAAQEAVRGRALDSRVLAQHVLTEFADSQVVSVYSSVVGTLHGACEAVKRCDDVPVVSTEIAVNLDAATLRAFIQSLESVSVTSLPAPPRTSTLEFPDGELIVTGGRVLFPADGHTKRYLRVVVQSAATLSCEAWNGTSGGMISITAKEIVIAQGGSVDVSGLGFRGGEVVTTDQGEAHQGESRQGRGQNALENNYCGGGGGDSRCAFGSIGGGGGGNGTCGNPASPNTHRNVTRAGGHGGQANPQVGSNNLADHMGGGGGAGGIYVRGAPGTGGCGGGCVSLAAETVELLGTVVANGSSGGCGSEYSSGGGGGAGGCVRLRAASAKLHGTIAASGGVGGLSNTYGPNNEQGVTSAGGAGGDGVVLVSCDAVVRSGDTCSPAPTVVPFSQGASWC